MRQPTSHVQAFQWWRDQLAGADQPIHESEIHCGYYKCRAYGHAARSEFPGLVFPAPFIPGRIWLAQTVDFEHGELADDETFLAEIGGRKWEATQAWLRLAKRPIPYREWTWLTARMPLLKLPSSAIRVRPYI